MSRKSRFIGAVDIGTSKIAVLIGELVPGGSVNLIGFGESPSQGVIKGSVTDFKTISHVTHTALLAAQETAKVNIDQVYLAQTGEHLAGFSNQAEVNVNAADNTVSQHDIDTVRQLAKSKALPDGRTVVQQIRRPFHLDGKIVDTSPVHLHGQRLAVEYWTVHGLETTIADSVQVICGFHVRVEELILSSLASGTMMTTPQDRKHGALVLDIGSGTTDFVLYRDGNAYMTGVVPVGGDHLTNDLSLGLRIEKEQAERLKRDHGQAQVITQEKQAMVWLNGNLDIGDRQIRRHSIEQITAARAGELFDVVKRKLGTELVPERCGAGVFLTGGTAQLPGMAKAATATLGVPAQVGELLLDVDDKLNQPAYSTVLGLLHYGLQNQSETKGRNRGWRDIWQRIFGRS